MQQSGAFTRNFMHFLVDMPPQLYASRAPAVALDGWALGNIGNTHWTSGLQLGDRPLRSRSRNLFFLARHAFVSVGYFVRAAVECGVLCV